MEGRERHLLELQPGAPCSCNPPLTVRDAVCEDAIISAYDTHHNTIHEISK